MNIKKEVQKRFENHISALNEYVEDCIQTNSPLNNLMVQYKAQEIYKKDNNEKKFVATNYWCSNYKKQNKLSTQKVRVNKLAVTKYSMK